MPDSAVVRDDVFLHEEVVEEHNTFSGVSFKGVPWDLSHLSAFSFKYCPDLEFEIDVVVVFSCHCFTHSFRWDSRAREDIPLDEIYTDKREARVLDPERYALSKTYLPKIIEELSKRPIKITPEDRTTQNFFTLEILDKYGKSRPYAVFIQPFKDLRRKRRIVLLVQSAYVLNNLEKRMANATKVSLKKLLKATYKGESIKKLR